MRVRVALALLATACTGTSVAPTLGPRPPPAATLTLTMDPLVPGEPVALAVYGAAPGELVRLVRSDGGVGACPPPVDALGARCLGQGTTGLLDTLRGRAGADGVVRWSVPRLPDVPDGDWWFQAVVLDGRASRVSNVLARPVRGCADDVLEPNDAASPAPLPGAITSPGLRACDDDAYELVVPDGEALRAVIRFAHAEGDLDLRLRDASGATLALSTSVTDDEAVAWLNATGAPVTVRLEVTVFADHGEALGAPYDLDVRVGPPGPCVDDAAEDDDLTASAPDLAAPLAGVACGADVDLRRVDLAAGDVLRVRAAAAPGDGGLVLAVLDAAGAVLVSDDLDPWALTWTATTTQTVFVRVREGVDDPLGGGVAYTVDAEVVPGGVCVDDAAEDDDDAASAAPLGGPAVACPGDEDWRAVSVQAGDTLTLTGADGPLDGDDVGVWLLDEAGDVLAFDLQSPFSLAATATADATWRLRVVPDEADPAQDGVPWELTAVLTRPAPCLDDGFEDDDSLAATTPLAPGAARHGVSCPGDLDHVGVAAPAGATVRFSVTVEDGGEVDLVLLDAQGRQLDADNRGALDVEARAVPGGVYAARVVHDRDDAAGGGVPYVVRAEVIVPAPCVDDPREDDDDQLTARPLAPGATAAAVACVADPDWHHVDADPADTVTVTVDVPPGTGSAELELYDAAGVRVARDTVLPLVLAAPAPVWARVALRSDDVGGGGVPYTVRVAATTGAPCAPDALEPDGDPTLASTLAVGATAATACVGDVDVFLLPVRRGERVGLTLSFDPAVAIVGDQDVDWILRDGAGAVLYGVDLDVRAPETLSVVAPADDVWTLEVRAARDDAAGGGVPYTLDLVIDPPAACADDGREPDDTLATAALTQLDAQVGARSCPADDDWLALSLLAGEGVYLGVEAPAAEGALAVELYDAAGGLLDADAFPPLDLVFGADVDQTVYARVVHVSDPDGDGIAYTVTTASLAPCAPDALEPDDDPASAPVLAPGLVPGLTACEAVDGDWVAVDLLAGETLDVVIRFDHDEGDLDLHLLDVGLAELASSTSVTDDERVTWRAPVDQRVFVRTTLFADRGDALLGNDYTLELSVR